MAARLDIKLSMVVMGDQRMKGESGLEDTYTSYSRGLALDGI